MFKYYPDFDFGQLLSKADFKGGTVLLFKQLLREPKSD